MNSEPETELWVICPVCHKGNPAGTKYCKHCWGAVIHPEIPVSSEELKQISKRRQSYLKRRKILKTLVISLVSLTVLASVLYISLYYPTNIFFNPPQDLNSNSPPGEWTMFGHDVGHSGTTTPSSTPPQGTLKWVFSTDSPIHSSPAVAYDTVYFGSEDNKFYALDAATGAKRWEYETGSWVESSPAIANGVVYFGSNDGKLYALDAYTGEKLWDFQTKYPITSSPAVAGGMVYFGGDDYYVYALDAETGKKIWDFKTGGYVISSPTIANGLVYVGSGSKFFYSLHALDGRLGLRFMSYYSVFSSPAVSNETIYFGSTNGYLYVVDAKARTWPLEHEIKPYWLQFYAMGLPVPLPPRQTGLLWRLRVGRTATSSPTVIADTLYIGADNKLLAIDLESYERRWEFEAEGTIRSSPAVLDTTIYVGSEDGRLYAVDTATGEKLWDILTGGKITSSPAVVDGTVYVGSHDGKLYAIR